MSGIWGPGTVKFRASPLTALTRTLYTLYQGGAAADLDKYFPAPCNLISSSGSWPLLIQNQWRLLPLMCPQAILLQVVAPFTMSSALKDNADRSFCCPLKCVQKRIQFPTKSIHKMPKNRYETKCRWPDFFSQNRSKLLHFFTYFSNFMENHRMLYTTHECTMYSMCICMQMWRVITPQYP